MSVRILQYVETSFTGRAVVPWHVMITTYSYFEADTGSADRAFLRSIPFDVMALDEAHNIKNAASSRHRSRPALISHPSPYLSSACSLVANLASAGACCRLNAAAKCY